MNNVVTVSLLFFFGSIAKIDYLYLVPSLDKSHR
jgi:hypothetical protein